MEIKILEYKCYKGDKVKVKSHNFRKGKWVINPNFEFHRSIANQDAKYTFGSSPTIFKHEYTREVK